MMNNANDQRRTCGTCGRPFPQATPKCNYNDCCLNEYNYTMPACIRNKQPDCTAMAVIPSITVETVDGLTKLANCFVHVTNTNTTYYIDDKHRPMIIWTGPIEVDIPLTVVTDEDFLNFVESFNLRSQFLYVKYYSTDTQQYGFISVYFDKNGRPYWAGEFNEITGQGGLI